MKGRLLKEEDYFNIASMQSVPEFLSWPRETPSYGKVFDRVPGASTGGEIESCSSLRFMTTTPVSIPSRVLPSAPFLKAYFKRYEVQIIKAFLHLYL